MGVSTPLAMPAAPRPPQAAYRTNAIVGDDDDTPRPLVDGALQSIGGGDRQLYTPYAGLPELRAAIAKKLQRHNGLPYEAANVAVTTGSSGAFSPSSSSVPLANSAASPPRRSSASVAT